MAGEELECQREPGNIEDIYAVALLRGGITVGHACSMFLRKGGAILCTITGNQRYFADLVQGGMEIPCKLTFSGEKYLVAKISHLLSKFDADPACTVVKFNSVKADTEVTDNEKKAK